jgi:glycosyltransferase involved in cell wall biosynthesis
VAERALNVVHVITRLTLGGSSENTVSTVVALGRAGYRVTLAVGLPESEPAVVDGARRRGCRIVEVPTLCREVAPARDLGAVRSLVGLYRRERADIVHTHTSKAGFVGRLAARLAGTAAVIHQPHGHIFYGYHGARRTRLYIALERLAARWSDRIVALTERGTEEHLARAIGRREQFVTIPSGVPTAALRARAPGRAEARARLGLDADAFVVAAVGRFVPIKGFDLLVAALPRLAAEVDATQVLLVGDGPERGALEAVARVLGVTHRLVLIGTASDVVTYMAAADVLAAPSRNEGMGRVIVEAMALGVPVVGAAVGGIPAVVVDGECGLIVPAEDPQALADALARLGRDPLLRAKLGAAAVGRAEAFSTGVMEARTLAIYRDLEREKRLR